MMVTFLIFPGILVEGFWTSGFCPPESRTFPTGISGKPDNLTSPSIAQPIAYSFLYCGLLKLLRVRPLFSPLPV
jgi:hypothetical protein